MKPMANINHIEIKMSKMITIPIILFGILLLILANLKTDNPPPIGIYVMSMLSIIYGSYLKSKRIYITNMDAKYKSWLSRKSIKNIESFNTSGIWILNSASITGRGKAIIKMYFIADFADVRKQAETIEDLKD